MKVKSESESQGVYNETQGLLEVASSTFLNLVDSTQSVSCPMALSFFQRLCPVPFPAVSLLITHTKSTQAFQVHNFVLIFFKKINSILSSIVYLVLEKAMAPHSSTLAWKIPWMEEPERLQSMGSLRVGHD